MPNSKIFVDATKAAYLKYVAAKSAVNSAQPDTEEEWLAKRALFVAENALIEESAPHIGLDETLMFVLKRNFVQRQKILNGIVKVHVAARTK